MTVGKRTSERAVVIAKDIQTPYLAVAEESKIHNEVFRRVESLEMT